MFQIIGTATLKAFWHRLHGEHVLFMHNVFVSNFVIFSLIFITLVFQAQSINLILVHIGIIKYVMYIHVHSSWERTVRLGNIHFIFYFWMITRMCICHCFLLVLEKSILWVCLWNPCSEDGMNFWNWKIAMSKYAIRYKWTKHLKQQF